MSADSNFFADMFQPSGLQPTPEQEAIIYSRDNPLKVMAFAGTGKTATLVMRANHCLHQRILYLAFNKSVEEEAQHRFSSNVTARTVHALAYSKIGRKFKLGKLSPYQVSKQLDLPYYEALLTMRTLENWLISGDSLLTGTHIAKDFLRKHKGSGAGALLDAARKLWRIMESAQSRDIPMTHSGYLKIFQLSQPDLPYDLLMVDEAQDTNGVTHALVMNQSSHEVLFVGDEKQSIYGWRGAVDALTNLNAPAMYLTNSFRFGPEIAKVANTILRSYFNEKMELKGLGLSQVGMVDITKPYTIITRTNAGLFKKAWEASRASKIYITGCTDAGDLPIFSTLMDVFYLWKQEYHNIKDPEVKCFDTFEQACVLAESECLDPEYTVALRIVNEYGITLPQRINEVKAAMVIQPELAQVRFTTAHRAKGLEWGQVQIGEDFPKLFDKAGHKVRIGYGDDEIEPQEINLLYVTATRAKKQLQLNPDLRRLMAEDFLASKHPADPV